MADASDATASTVPKDAADVRPGVRLGRYEILLGIAQGGMARVWAALQHGQRGFTKLVAIKTILPTLATDPEFEAMFLDEARVASGVHHPNVCEIFDLGEESGVLYLAMEWVHGDSLSRILRPVRDPNTKPTRERLNARIAARILADACAGVHAAHELCDEAGNRLSVVHRDVSPQNILVSLDGTVKMTDFGVAKALGSSHQSTSAGQLKGKAPYMSPEQASGGRVDRRSDVFALGSVLYEATTGVRAFASETQRETLERVIAASCHPPSSVVPGYPKELEAIVLRAMVADPRQRFPTADRMRVALEEWLAGSGPIVTQTQVGALIRERVGTTVEERRVRIRERQSASALTRSSPPTTGTSERPAPPPPSPSPSPSPSSSTTPELLAEPEQGMLPSGTPPPHVTSSSRPGTARTALLGVALGLAAFATLAAFGGGAYLLVRSREAPAAREVGPTPAVPPIVSAPPASTDAPAARTSRATIRIHSVVPSVGVRYRVDGVALDPAVTSIARPAPGNVLLLEAEADGYKRELIRVDESAPDILDVILVEQALAHGAAKPAAPPPPPAGQAARADREKKRRPIQPDIPENPF